ncbi:MAG: hypothetical protein PHV06_08825 [bacterium]|nr:hypothetical protein [bacterium]
MNKNNFFKVLLIIFILIPHTVLCHDNVSVHTTLTENASLLIDNSYQELKYFGYLNNIKNGSKTEDEPFFNCLKHFYNPYTDPSGLVGYPDAITYCKTDRWKGAIELYDYTNESKIEAYEYLGKSLHLLQDLSVPSHVHHDGHIYPPDDYEEYCKDNCLNLSNGNSIREWSDLVIIFNEMAHLAYEVNRFQGNLSSANPQPETELTKMFPDLQWIWVGLEPPFSFYYSINDVGNYYPFLDPLSLNDWWECSSDYGNYYIENIDIRKPDLIRKDLTKPFDPSTNPMIPNKIYLTDHYFNILISPAIEYSAGMMKFYYDLVNHPPYVKEVIVYQGKEKKYNAYWEDSIENNKVIERILIPEIENNLNIKRIEPGEIRIEIEFNKGVEFQRTDIKIGNKEVDAVLEIKIRVPASVICRGLQRFQEKSVELI